MRHFAVVGSGPAGFYTAEALEKAYGAKARIDILDRYPVPYGLIRFGVAPHDRKLGIPGEELTGVIGSAEFVGWYNGHPEFADLDPPLDGTHAAVIGNGNVALDCARILTKTHHEFEGSDIVGHALDALDKSAIRTVTILGRRGPHQIAMTPKELGELAHLEAAVPVVEPADFPPVEADEPLDPGLRKSVSLLRGFEQLEAGKP